MHRTPQAATSSGAITARPTPFDAPPRASVQDGLPGLALARKLRGAAPWLVFVCTVVSGGATPTAAPGQEVQEIPEAQGARDACPDGRITHIFVDNRSIFDLEEVDESRFGWVYRLANRLHMDTHERFLQRELLVRVGDCYNRFLVEDSERILRRLWFISQVEVYGVRLPGGDWHVVVDTKDEWTTKVDVQVAFDGAPELRAIEVVEENFVGRGIVLGAFLRETDAARLVGGRAFTPRLFNTRLDGFLTAGETRIGASVRQALVYPFVGEVGRYAGRQLYQRREDYFTYASGTPDRPQHLLLPLDEERIEVTLAARVGEPGNLTIFGLGISRTHLAFPGFPTAVEVVEDNAFSNRQPAARELAARLEPHTRFRAGTRVNLLLGQRNVDFVQRRGLDALRGLLDVEVGTEMSLTLGRTVGALASEDRPDDLYTRLRLYAATAPGPVLLASALGVEARQIFSGAGDEDGWRDVLAELDVLFYLQSVPWQRHTFFGRLVAAGGWDLDQPYQLTLGGPTGVRGYHDEDYPGNQRVVLTAEDRIYLGWPYPDLFDLGATVFADIGHMWAGDAPFGVDSGWRATLGAGLRVGFPAGTRGVVRLDAAWPLGPSPSLSDVVFRVSFSDLIGLGARLSDPQMQRSRRMTVGPDRFHPPR